MLDLNLIREKPEVVRKALRDRQLEEGEVARVLELDARRRALLPDLHAKKAERNAVPKEIGRMKDPAERHAKN